MHLLLAAAVEGFESVDLTSFVTALTSSITPTQILTILGSVVGVGMAFFLMWLGVRKAVSIFQNTVKSGKLKL